MCITVSAMSLDCRQSKAEQIAAALSGSPGYIACWNSVSTRPGEIAATLMFHPRRIKFMMRQAGFYLPDV